MNRRGFEHSNNPAFHCRESVLLLPFGRESYLPAIVDAVGGTRIDLGETSDRIVFDLDRLPVPLTLVFGGAGGPATANALEMVAGNGGRRVVVFGACGGVDRSVGVGDLVVATAGVRGDGASVYYVPLAFPAVLDPDLTRSLWREASSRPQVGAHRGIVVTTDASYRQGAEIYETYAGLALAVECECATAAVVGLRLGLEVGCLLFCTDNVVSDDDGDRSYRGLSDERVRAGFESGLDAVIAATR